MNQSKFLMNWPLHFYDICYTHSECFNAFNVRILTIPTLQIRNFTKQTRRANPEPETYYPEKLSKYIRDNMTNITISDCVLSPNMDCQ